MPVELLDTQLTNGPWRVAVLERIERLTSNGEVFFFSSTSGGRSNIVNGLRHNLIESN